MTLQSGEELQLERTGDLGEGNAGMLIFVDRRQRPRRSAGARIHVVALRYE